jgi:acetamidase/formamidase
MSFQVRRKEKADRASRWSSGPLVMALGLAIACGPATANGPPKGVPFIHHLKSTNANTNLGGFIIDSPAVLNIQSGDLVRVDVINQSGATSSVHPVTYFGQFGVAPEEVLPDAIDFWNSLPSRVRYGPHILTGPIYIEGAEPGDTIELQILDVYQRVPFGVNNTAPQGGVLSTSYPGYREGDKPLNIAAAPPNAPAGLFPNVRQHLYRTGKVKGEDVALFSDNIRVPLRPFFGVMGVAPPTGQFIGNTEDSPPPVLGVQSSTQPWNFGGNIDSHVLRKGAKVYFPVFQNGAQFFLGDTHSVQGDGEVSGTALEHSLAGVFKFVLHKKTGQKWPMAENKDHYIMMGFHWDLDRAMRNATVETIEFLTKRMGLTDAKAFSLASIGIDYVNSEVVDRTQLVSAFIPKRYFLQRPASMVGTSN